MNVRDFKLWFDGLVCGLPAGAGLHYMQVEALIEKVKSLDTSGVVPVSGPSPMTGDKKDYDQHKDKDRDYIDPGFIRKIIEDMPKNPSKIEPRIFPEKWVPPLGPNPGWPYPEIKITATPGTPGSNPGWPYAEHKVLPHWLRVEQREDETLSDFLNRAAIAVSDHLVDQATIDSLRDSLLDDSSSQHLH